MNTKIPECWSSDPNAHGVRIELSSEGSLLLPFEQFAFGELKNEGKQQHLRLVFATHEVSIRGNALRRIETTMQRMELSFLTALPSAQRSLISVRTWQHVLDEIIAIKTGPTQERWKSAAKDKAYDLIRHRVLIETHAEHLLTVLRAGKVSTNAFLRKIHNFAVDMNWLLATVIPRRQ